MEHRNCKSLGCCDKILDCGIDRRLLGSVDERLLDLHRNGGQRLHVSRDRRQGGNTRRRAQGNVRTLAVYAMSIGTGNTIPGEIGGIQHTRDGGETWEYVALPVLANSVVYGLAPMPRPRT